MSAKFPVGGSRTFFSSKSIALCIFEWPIKTGFTVIVCLKIVLKCPLFKKKSVLHEKTQINPGISSV